MTPDPAMMSPPHALVIEPSCMLPGAKLFSMQLTHSLSRYGTGQLSPVQHTRGLSLVFGTI